MWTVLALMVGCGGDTASTDDSGSKSTPPDADGDGYVDREDCAPDDASVHPGVSGDTCDTLDNDCDGAVDEDPTASFYPDEDGDGFGASTGAVLGCEAPAGMVGNHIDCDDQDATALPDGTEVCDEADNDCDGQIDEDASGVMTWPIDRDGDGSGSPTETVSGCTQPTNGVDNTYDCDDNNPNLPAWVDAAAGASGNGTMSRPFSSINAALLQGGSCVALVAGTYVEPVEISGDTVTIMGVDGSAVTTVEGWGTGPGSGPVFSVTRGGALTLEGVTVSQGGGQTEVESSSYSSGSYTYHDIYTWYRGGGVYVADSTFHGRDLVLQLNDAGRSDYVYSDVSPDYYYYYYQGQGGAIYAENAEVTLTDVTLHANTSGEAGALYQLGGSLDTTRLKVTENGGDNLTLYLVDVTASFTNLLMYENGAPNDFSGIQGQNSDLSVWNSTITGNYIGIYLVSTGSVALYNSIISDNVYGLADDAQGNAGWEMSYNDLFNNETELYGLASPVGLNGNVAVNPGFVSWIPNGSATGDNLRLAAGSTLIDAGSPAVLDVDGSRSDVGGYGGPEGDWP